MSWLRASVLLVTSSWLACAEDHSPARPVSDAEVSLMDATQLEDTSPPDAGRAGRVCKPAELTDCPLAIVPVAITGSSPFGKVRVTELGVGYWQGFTQGTRLRVSAQVAGQPLHISAQAYTIAPEHPNSPLCRPDLYDTAAPDRELRTLFAVASYCEETVTLEAATMRVDAHRALQDGPIAAGTAVELRGTFMIADAGWSLTIPFEISRACDTWTDL